MKILSYILVIFVATVPMLWIEQYTVTNPIFWTVMAAHFVGRSFGYFECLKKNKKEKKDEE